MVNSIVARLGLDTNAFQTGMKDAGSKLNRFQMDWRQAWSAAKVGVLGAVGAVTGLGALMISVGREALSSADQIKDMADSLNMTTTAFQSLTQAFAQNGTASEKFTKGFGKFLETLQEARDGGDAAIEKFTDLGISIQDIRSLKPEDIFYKVSDGLANTEDRTERLSYAMQIFGKSGRQMNILAGQGSDAVKAAMGESIVASQMAIDNLADAADKIEGFMAGMKAITIEVTSFILGGFKMLGQQLEPYLKMLGSIKIGGTSLATYGQMAGGLAKAVGRLGQSEETAQQPVEPPAARPEKGKASTGKTPEEQYKDDLADYSDRYTKNQEGLTSGMHQGASDYAAHSQQSSQSRHDVARGRRAGQRAENRANRRYGLNDSGIPETSEGAKRMIRDQERGRISQLAPDQQALLEQQARESNVAPGNAPTPPESSGSQKQESKNLGDAAGKAAPGGPDDTLTVLKDISKSCGDIAQKFGQSI